MTPRRVVFSPHARNDLARLFDWIFQKVGADVAGAYLARVELYCLDLEVGPERGTRHDDVRPGLRIVGFERSLTIAFTVADDRVTILRCLYRGRDWARDLR